MKSVFYLIVILVFSGSAFIAYGALTVTDRIEIDDDDISADIAAGDQFGYVIESIGDLDSDGVTDLATIKFSDDSGETNAGSILILFMNSDGTVKGTNEITMDVTASGIGSSCIVGDSTNVSPVSLESMAFVGDLDGDGEPTLALGAPRNDHGGLADSGAVYMLELNTDGTVDNCLRIIPGENGFAPANNRYLEAGDAFFGWPLIATDLNGDGQNELIAGASEDGDATTNLWVFFLASTGAVASHPSEPIKGVGDIGVTEGTVDRDYFSDGDTIDGGTKIVIGVENGDDIPDNIKGDIDEVGAIHIINLNSDGTFGSSTRIDGISLGQGISIDNGEENFGTGVAGIGDMDGDGVNDILVGNRTGDDTNADSGEVYILFMNSDDTVRESQKISNESENTRNGSTPFALNDFFGHGMTLWKDEPEHVIIAIGAYGDATGGATSGAIHLFTVQKTSDTITSGGSGCADCIAPTLGLNENFQRVVDNGFSYNNNSVQVGNWHTSFPLINATVGEINTVEIIVYENQGTRNLKMVQFGLGGHYIGQSLSTFEGIIEVPLFINSTSNSLETDEITIHDKDNLIENSSVIATASIVSCGALDCVKVLLEYSYREATINNMMLVNVWDNPRNSQNFYFNDGVKVIGESLNPTNTMDIIPVTLQNYPQKRGLVELTQIDRGEKLWVDPYGYIWQGDSSKIVLISTISPQPRDDPKSVWSGYNDRLNSNFASYKQEQIEKAQKTIDTLYINIQGDDLTDYVAETIHFEITDRVDDGILQQRMINETNRAEMYLEELLSTHRVHLE